uniref:integron-associated HEPN domain-containing protein n=1 Tax=Cellvibrio fontiphilus TaxID=1815559 RepID=UPI002B4C1A82|nr:integron-associated HEPN domain-containing protein [Cellvibrio fontiphilus]
MRNEKSEMRWLLEDQIYDLCAPINLMRSFINSKGFDPSTSYTLSVFRLCNHGLIISLFKLHEIIKNYGAIIEGMPEELKSPFTKVNKLILSKEIPQFRNRYVAHIFEKKKGEVGKPLSVKKGMELLEKIMGKSIEEMLVFYEWVYPENYNENGDSVVAIVQRVRDHCLTFCVPGEKRS